METFHDITSLCQYLGEKQIKGQSIGFVPTMGALHRGHLRLISESVKNNHLTVCSIFVNPTQFNNSEDLDKYPRPLERDLELLRLEGCDVAFIPDVSEMYSEERILSMSFGYLEEIMEGKFRPNHFKGVGLVVAKLFNIVRPHRAYFGRKDLQQFVLIRKLVEELNFQIELHAVDTVREDSGLAMSSRNVRLSEQERQQAMIFYRSLIKAKSMLKGGHAPAEVKSTIESDFEKQKNVSLEYFEIVDTETLLHISNISPSRSVSICTAGYVGKIRLIDNISLF